MPETARSVRLPEPMLAQITAFAAGARISQHAAMIELLKRGLGQGDPIEKRICALEARMPPAGATEGIMRILDATKPFILAAQTALMSPVWKEIPVPTGLHIHVGVTWGDCQRLIQAVRDA